MIRTFETVFHTSVLIGLLAILVTGCAKRLELPDIGPPLPYTARLELAPSVNDVKFEYTDNCGHLRPVPIGSDLEYALIEMTHRLFKTVLVDKGRQDAPPDVIIRMDLVDSALKLQTDNVYDRVPAEIRLNALAKIQDASGKLLREPDIAVTRQERLRIEPLQKNCEYIFEPFLSNAIVEFAAKYAAETRSVFEPPIDTASPADAPSGQLSQAKAVAVSPPLLSDVRSTATGLSFKAKILDENNNMILEGGERIRIHIDMANGGTEAIHNITASINGHDMLTAQFPATTLPVGTLHPGDSKSLDFIATLPQSLQAEQVQLSVTVMELATKTGPPNQTLVAALGPMGTTHYDIDQIPTLATSFQQPDNYLVAAGLSTYRDPAVPTRKHASHDAQVISRYFHVLGGIPAANIRLLQDGKALRPDLEEAILDWLPAHITKNSTVILYFAGQALVTSTGETFLIPYDGSTTATSRLYPLKDLEAGLSRLKVKQKVFIFDGSIVKLDGDRHPKSQGPLWHASTESMVRLIGTSGIGRSLESDTFRHGLFTYSLLRGLRGDADTNRNGEVTLGELSVYVNQEVPSIAKTTLRQDQRPQVIPSLRATDRSANLVLTKPSVLTSSQHP
jgi:hypothetical protein